MSSKWFKHHCHNHRSEAVQYLLDKHGSDGPFVYYTIYEMCMEKLYQSAVEDGLKLNSPELQKMDYKYTFHRRIVCSILRIRPAKVTHILRSCATSGLLTFEFRSENFEFKVPKLLKLLNRDAKFTRSGRAKDALDTRLEGEKEKEKDKDKEEELKKKINKKEKPNTGVFLSEIENLYFLFYPRKVGKTKGVQKLSREIKTEQDLADLKKSINNYAKLCVGKDTEYIKHFSTFASCWRDYVDESVVEENTKPIDPLAELKLKLSMKG